MNSPRRIIGINFPPSRDPEPDRSPIVDVAIIAMSFIIGGAIIGYLAHRETIATRCDCLGDAEACGDLGRDAEPCNYAWRLHP